MPAVRPVVLGLALFATACAKNAPASRSADSASSEATPGAVDADESITNTQEQGVDEGGIIKTHGDHLVVLRRGRLFSIDLGGDRLRPRSVIDVPPRRGHDAWYDEMLIHGDTIVVIGYSYRFSATEIGLFRIDDKANLSHVDTFFLNSNDYYSSRNYASRLVGDQLVFYMPQYASTELADDSMPGVKEWHRGLRRKSDWHRIMDATDVVAPIEADPNTLHALVTCDLSRPDLGCRGRGILGGAGRSFYVSGQAVYVWTHSGGAWSASSDAALYRLPLDGGPIGAVKVMGAPIDQFSFKEAGDGRLHVVLRTESHGDGMWGPERSAGDLGIVTVPANAFARWGGEVPQQAYRDLPDPTGDAYAFQNRFVGDALLYGNGTGWGYAAESLQAEVHAHHVDGDWGPQVLRIPHGVDRLEPLGADGLVVGTDGRDLHFSSVALRDGAELAGHFVQPNAAQGELRSHGFFFKPSGEGDGMLGLPLRVAGGPGYAHLFDGSAAVLYLDVKDLQMQRLGMLLADPNTDQNDQCVASCVDWYGNARPVFYKGRVFALMGYELVEGKIADGRMTEVRRLDMLDLVRGEVVRAPG